MSSQIVLLHGWGCDHRIWEPLLPFFESVGRVNAINISYCQSDLIDTENKLCQHIASQLQENSILCGWSLGGMLALRIAAQYPQKVRALITLASNAVFVAKETWPDAMSLDTFKQFLSIFERNVSQALKRFIALEVYGDAQAAQQKQWLQKQEYIADKEQLHAGLKLLERLDNTRELSSLVTPSLFCFGQHDSLVPVSSAYAFSSVMKAQHRVEVLPSSGHLLHYPTENLIPILHAFIRSVLKGERQ